MITGSTWLHAPTTLGLGFLPSPTFPPQPLSKFNACFHSVMAAPPSVRIAIVGDVHDDWNLEEDRKALQLLKPDLVLFTGDFGNENVDLVRSIADLDIPKAVILGNHDAWRTQMFSGREKDNVQHQLESCVLISKRAILQNLGDEHVGYRRTDYPTLKLSIVGGRPFSCGGASLFRKKLLVARYGIHDMDGSAKRIYDAASRTPEDHLTIFLAHNGPTGLGSNMNDICGRDWVYGGGDHGDPDLALAISQLKEATKLSIPLVVFGHMHNQLQFGNELRKMIVVGDDDTVYLNGALVPRVRRLGNEQGTFNQQSISDETSVKMSGTLRAFTIVEITERQLEKVAETWVAVTAENISIAEEHIMYDRESASH